MEKSSENVGVISNENSKLIDIDKSMPEVTNLSLTTDETTNQESVIVVNYVKQNVSPIRHSGEVWIHEVDDEVMVHKEIEDWLMVPINGSRNYSESSKVNGADEWHNL